MCQVIVGKYFTIIENEFFSSDGVDFSKHSGVIAYIRSQYVKTGVIDVKFSELIRNAESIRNDCDYKDFYMPDKEELNKQLPIVKEFLACIEEIISCD